MNPPEQITQSIQAAIMPERRQRVNVARWIEQGFGDMR
jgi:hypothetical protein